MTEPEIPTAAEYRDALLALGAKLTPTRRKLLRVHAQARSRQLTMSQLADAMGWKSFSSANLHYGKLSELIGRQLRFRYRAGQSWLRSTCTFIAPEEPGDHWLIILRPQVAEAMRELGWA